MNLSQIIRILSARRGLVFTVWLLVVAVTVALSLVLPKRYVASVSLVIDSKATDPVTGAMLPLQLMPSHLATQVDVIESHNAALKVVDRLHLTQLPAIREEFRNDTGGVGSLRDWLADRLIDRLDAKPSRESSIVEVSYASADPQVAAQMANAFADAYIQTSVELKADPARRQAGWFEGQVEELRSALESAQRKLSEYQQQHQIVSTDVDRLDIENARLAELSTQLVAAQTQMYGAQTRQSQMNHAEAGDRLAELPDVAGNPLVQNLKAEIARAEAKLAEIGSRYGRNHPQYQSARAELDALRIKLAGELDTSKGSINQAAQIAQRQAAELQEALTRQKQRVLELSTQRDELAVLMRDVASARAAYETAMQRTSHVRLESQLDQTDVAVLNPAVAPLRPEFPLLGLNIVLACVLGAMLGVGLALVFEMSDKRIRSRDDLTGLAGVPVLAELRRIERRHRRRLAQLQSGTPQPARKAR